MVSNVAILPKKVKKLDGLATELRRTQATIANKYHRSKLEEIVAPFDSRITFRVMNRYKSGSYVTNIAPTDEIAGVNAADTPVTSKELFNWLDEGTSVTTVAMPEEFSNETTPNSLNTVHSDYDRDEIYFTGNVYPGIEARKFLKQIGELYKDAYEDSINQVIKTYVS